jgi:hypothetical protein
MDPLTTQLSALLGPPGGTVNTQEKMQALAARRRGVKSSRYADARGRDAARARLGRSVATRGRIYRNLGR